MSKHDFTPNQIRLFYKRPKISELPHIGFDSEAVNVLRPTIEEGTLDLKQSLWVLLLTDDNHLLGISELNSSTKSGVSSLSKQVMQLGLLSNASSIIIVRNNIDGSLLPSYEDISLSKKINKMGKLMKIHLRDSLIITSESYKSINSYFK